MMDEGTTDLQELVRLPDVLVVCSSKGWTDEKHMLYLQLLEETFVNQLHDDERSFKGLFNLPPIYCRSVKSSKQIVEYTRPDQDGEVHSMDDNTSTTEPVEEAISEARATSSGQSTTSYVVKHRHSPSRSAEVSDQNFDEETKGIGESRTRRGCSQKRLKSFDVTRDDQVVPFGKPGCQKAGGLIASGKHEDKYNGLLKVDAGSLDAQARSPTC